MAALHHVSDAVPGIRRIRRGAGMQYVGPDGPVSAEDKARIEGLAIPPAWEQVWICPDPDGHIQATGRDAKGRKVYRYHPRWRRTRDQEKFRHVTTFGEVLPTLRSHVEHEIGRGGRLTQDRVVALVIALLDETLIRIGNDEYLRNGSRGLTTLAARHAEWHASQLTFRFTGKSGTPHEVPVEDRRLGRLVRRCHQLGGQDLFTYQTPDGEVRGVTSTMVNDQLREVSGVDISAKEFRTWGGSVAALSHLVQAGADVDDTDVLEAIDHAAGQLGNSRAVCRASYVHPAVPRAALDGSLLDVWKRTRARRHLERAEATLLRVLQQP